MASADYKKGYDERISKKIEIYSNNQIQLFKDSINDPIRYHNTQVRIWSSSKKFLYLWESNIFSEQLIQKLSLSEYELS